MLSPKTILVLGVALSGIIAILTRKPARAGTFFAGIFITFGVVSLASGRVLQEWDGGPPVEGPLAIIFSLVLIAVGVYLLLFSLLKTDNGEERRDDEKV